jgi:YhcN/YlaJ family sporulation lipoprotein
VKLIFVSLLLITLMTGCGQSPQDGASSSQDANQNQIHVNQIAPPKQKITDPKAVTERLEKLASSIPQVESAHCVVFGDVAVVGINVSKDMDRARVGTIKYSVAEALRKDPYGVHAIVTADMDLDQRLRDIRDNIRNGKPIVGFGEQMAEIIGRIMPQLPQDIQPPPNNPAPQDSNRVGNPNL